MADLFHFLSVMRTKLNSFLRLKSATISANTIQFVNTPLSKASPAPPHPEILEGIIIPLPGDTPIEILLELVVVLLITKEAVLCFVAFFVCYGNILKQSNLLYKLNYF